MSEWISLSAQMPTLNDGLVLLFMPVNKIQCIGFYVPRLDSFDLGAERIPASNFSHWQRLPPAPHPPNHTEPETLNA